MYHFNPNGKGRQFFVLAEDKHKAHEYLLQRLKADLNISIGDINSEEKKEQVKQMIDEFHSWNVCNPLDDRTLPEDYTIVEWLKGCVNISEVR